MRDLGHLDVAERLRAERARCDWLGWRTDERKKWVETWRYKRHILTDEA
jgi:hypothetical protein